MKVERITARKNLMLKVVFMSTLYKHFSLEPYLPKDIEESLKSRLLEKLEDINDVNDPSRLISENNDSLIAFGDSELTKFIVDWFKSRYFPKSLSGNENTSDANLTKLISEKMAETTDSEVGLIERWITEELRFRINIQLYKQIHSKK